MRLFFKILNIVFAVICLLIIGFMLGRKYDIAIDENDKLVGVQYSANELKIRRLVSLIDSQYMEEVNSDSLVDNAISQIIGQLDPHSTYLNKKDLQRVTQEMSGHFEGLGIQVRIMHNFFLRKIQAIRFLFVSKEMALNSMLTQKKEQ